MAVKQKQLKIRVSLVCNFKMTTETIYATICKPVQSLVKYQSYYRKQYIT